jgi:hypothetical protein
MKAGEVALRLPGLAGAASGGRFATKFRLSLVDDDLLFASVSPHCRVLRC